MIGWQEIILILAILLIVFGPAKLPKLARELGKAWNTIVKASSGLIEPGGSGQTTENNYRDKLLSEVAKNSKSTPKAKRPINYQKRFLRKY